MTLENRDYTVGSNIRFFLYLRCFLVRFAPIKKIYFSRTSTVNIFLLICFIEKIPIPYSYTTMKTNQEAPKCRKQKMSNTEKKSFELVSIRNSFQKDGININLNECLRKSVANVPNYGRTMHEFWKIIMHHLIVIKTKRQKKNKCAVPWNHFHTMEYIKQTLWKRLIVIQMANVCCMLFIIFYHKV